MKRLVRRWFHAGVLLLLSVVAVCQIMQTRGMKSIRTVEVDGGHIEVDEVHHTVKVESDLFPVRVEIER